MYLASMNGVSVSQTRDSEKKGRNAYTQGCRKHGHQYRYRILPSGNSSLAACRAPEGFDKLIEPIEIPRGRCGNCDLAISYPTTPPIFRLNLIESSEIIKDPFVIVVRVKRRIHFRDLRNEWKCTPQKR